MISMMFAHQYVIYEIIILLLAVYLVCLLCGLISNETFIVSEED